MAGDDDQSFEDSAGFGDLLDEVDESSAFDWDEPDVEDEPEKTRPVVSFRVGDDRFAVHGETVREIIGSTERTLLPGAPAHINGITVVRRQVVGLLSLRRFLGLGPSTRKIHAPDDDESSGDQTDSSRTVIVETAHFTIGLCVDEVMGLDEWPESKLDPDTLPENIRDKTHRYARGARRAGDDLCVYLDVESLLDDAAVQ